MKKQKSFFIIIPKNRDVLFASWKIYPEESPKKVSKKLIGAADLILDIHSVNGNKKTKIDSVPVYGLENNWHIFTKKEYRGKRLVFKLCYRGARGGITELISSKEIDIPLSEGQFSQIKKSTIELLFSLSGINLTAYPGPDKNSSW